MRNAKHIPNSKEGLMRLNVNRVIALAALVAAGLMAGCSADSPGPTTNPHPGPGTNGLLITLSATPANPLQGGCSLVVATATQDGVPVPAGTSIFLSSTFGAFAQNGLQTISLVTQNGTVTTAICSNTVGPATITGTVTVGSNTDRATTQVVFQPNGIKTTFISVCANPHSGPVSGGTPIVITGGGFGANGATIPILFRSGAFVHQAIGIVGGTPAGTTITVTTPAFPELTGLPATPVQIDVVLPGQTLSSPACFTFTTEAQPVVSAILPSSGSKVGGTRVTITGSGFSAPVQVFFGGTLEAQVVSVSPTEIIVITPPANGEGPAQTFPENVDVVVKEVNCSGATCTSAPVTFTYTVGLSIFGFTPDHGDSSTVVTITGQGFVAPLIVTFGGIQGTVVSVTGTQVLATPPPGCPSSGGQISVTLLSTGESATSSGSFTVGVPTITSGPSPGSGPGGHGTLVTVTGTNLFRTGTNPTSSVSPAATGGTVQVNGGSEVNGQQTLTLTITPDSCSNVSFTLINTATGCPTSALSFTNSTTTTAPTASFTQCNTGLSPCPTPATSHGVTFASTSTGANSIATCSWTFTDSATTTSSACTTTVDFTCGTSGPACTTAPTATLTVTDQCGNTSTATQTVSPP